MPTGFDIGLSIATRVAEKLGPERHLRVDPHLAHNFVVEIEGLLIGGFHECRGLTVQTEVFEYREGGQNGFVHTFAGPTRHPPLVLKHGLSPIDGLWRWHQDVVAGVIERRNGTLYLLDTRRVPLMWWDFSGALPVNWTGPDMNASTPTVAFETVELVHQGLSRPRLATATEIAGELRARVDIPGGFF
jgi:phage tail-like protein